MSDDRMFERDARAWLELGPKTAPRRVVEATLLKIEITPQQRDLRVPWRFPHMTIQTRFAVAAAIGLLAVGASLLILRSPQSQVGTPSPSPTASPSSSPVSLEELHGAWASVGTRSDPLGDNSNPPHETYEDIAVDAAGLRIDGYKEVISSASIAGAGGQLTLRLEAPQEMLSHMWDCATGDTGTYHASLSADGQTLTLTSESDECTTRGEILTGDWTRWACPDLGFCDHFTDQSPGRHVAPIFKPFDEGASGQFAYTVPAGWLQSIVPPTWPDRELPSNAKLLIRRAPNDTGIDLFSNVVMGSSETWSAEPLNCVRTAPKPNASPAEVATWLASLDGLLVTAPEPVSIGGLSGVMVDLSFTPGWTDPCAYSLQEPDGPATYVGRRTLFRETRGTDIYDEGLSATDDDWARYILLDRGDGQILLVRVQTQVKAIWEALLVDAMPVIESFEFIP